MELGWNPSYQGRKLIRREDNRNPVPRIGGDGGGCYRSKKGALFLNWDVRVDCARTEDKVGSKAQPGGPGGIRGTRDTERGAWISAHSCPFTL